MDSSAGELLRRASEIDAALDARFSLGLDEITAEEWSALMVIRTERERYRREAEKR